MIATTSVSHSLIDASWSSLKGNRQNLKIDELATNVIEYIKEQGMKEDKGKDEHSEVVGAATSPSVDDDPL